VRRPGLGHTPGTAWRTRLRTVATVALAAVIGLGGPAWAHFLLNANIRTVHVEHLADGLRVYMRLPMPYLVAGKARLPTPEGLPSAAPYTVSRIEDERLVHYVDLAALHRDPLGLGRLAADGHRIAVGGRVLRAEVEAARAHTALEQPPFATLGEARKAFTDSMSAPASPPPYVGDTVIDVRLRYRADTPVYDYVFSSHLDPGLPEQEQTANLILDHLAGEPLVFRERGALHAPVSVSRSALAAAGTFVVEGMHHILAGLDHVLFVLCLAIGAHRAGSLVTRVTGFTLGHSLTLAFGVLGWVPAGAWFVPAVETLIAVSIVYAAVVALHQRGRMGSFPITVLIGLVHGLGFSFVLREILRLDSPNVAQTLLAFNVGVEIGQLAIVLAVWPALRVLSGHSSRLGEAARWAIAVPCVAIAALWTTQRGLELVQALPS